MGGPQDPGPRRGLISPAAARAAGWVLTAAGAATLAAAWHSDVGWAGVALICAGGGVLWRARQE